jgi:hypothetical protein
MEGASCGNEGAAACRISCHALRRWMTSGPVDFAKTPAGT